MKHSLTTTGLSLSQAQSISNLCYQKAVEITSTIATVNNASKTIVIGDKSYTVQDPVPLPKNIVELVLRKASLHGLQAFLMQNIKRKNDWLEELKKQPFKTELKMPVRSELKTIDTIPVFEEKDAWHLLTVEEYNEFLEKEALAAHIGQFIHKDGKLTLLRDTLPTLQGLDWYEVKDGEKTPVIVTKHHTSEELLVLHEKLAAMHRDAESRVNYFKAKVKNLHTLKNAEIAEKNSLHTAEVTGHNNNVTQEFETEYKKYQGQVLVEKTKFEQERLAKIKDVAALRITVPERFQPLVDQMKENLEN